MKIPPSKLPEFSKAYFDMFVKYDNGAGRVFMDRRDPQVRMVDGSTVGVLSPTAAIPVLERMVRVSISGIGSMSWPSCFGFVALASCRTVGESTGRCWACQEGFLGRWRIPSRKRPPSVGLP